MGLFSRSCPLEKAHIEIYGIHSPRKWKKEDCLICSYYQERKCAYNPKTASPGQLRKRGYPALVKKSLLPKPAAERGTAEKEAVKQAGYSLEQEETYWKISREIDAKWVTASPEQQQEILDGLDQFKVYLESGLSTSQAYEKAQDWLQKRSEFRSH